MKSDRQQLVGIIIDGCAMMADQALAGRTQPVFAPTTTDRDDSHVVPVVNWKQFKGELEKKWADITDDDFLYIEGHEDKLDGKFQARYGDQQEEVKKWVEEWFERHDAQG